MDSKKPDSVVYNTDTEKYDASLRPYATDLAAPVIHAENLAPWKNRGVGKVNSVFPCHFNDTVQLHIRKLPAF